MITPPQGRLTLTIETPDGRLVARREARNLVVKGGAQIIAGLFSGKGKTAIDNVRIGFGKATADVSSTALTAPPQAIDAAHLRAPLTGDDFTVDASSPTSVTVRITAPFSPQEDKIEGVSEAGLFAGDTLYNQVVFEPITLVRDHVITFFWQVDFPFGR
jgi:hypothetical protein